MRSALLIGLVVFASVDARLAGQSSTAPPRQASPASAVAKPAAKVTLPAAIDAAFKKAYPNATIKHVSKELEHGVTLYEVESVDGGQRRDLIYKADGTLVEYEEAIAESALPQPVMAAVKTRYPKATITRVEKLFQNGAMKYELGLKGAKVSEAVLTPDGTWVSPK